jgi:hypothetical protein
MACLFQQRFIRRQAVAAANVLQTIDKGCQVHQRSSVTRDQEN